MTKDAKKDSDPFGLLRGSVHIVGDIVESIGAIWEVQGDSQENPITPHCQDKESFGTKEADAIRIE